MTYELIVAIVAVVVAFCAFGVAIAQLKKSKEANELSKNSLISNIEQNRRMFFAQKLHDLFIFAVQSEELIRKLYESGSKLDDFLQKSYRLETYHNYVVEIREYSKENNFEKTVVDIRNLLAQIRQGFRNKKEENISEIDVKNFEEAVMKIRDKLVNLEKKSEEKRLKNSDTRKH